MAEKLVIPAPMSPTQAKALSRLGALRRGTRETRRHFWPGTEIPFLMRVLTCDEMQACYAGAVVRFRELNIPFDTLTTVGIFEEEIALQVIARACRDPDAPDAPFCPSPDDMRQNSTADERTAVFNLYIDLQHEVNPQPDRMAPEEFSAIEALVKKKDRSGLNACARSTLVTFLLIGDSQPSS